jgi:hypothetical protein
VLQPWDPPRIRSWAADIGKTLATLPAPILVSPIGNREDGAWNPQRFRRFDCTRQTLRAFVDQPRRC